MVSSNQSENNYNPGLMDFDTIYYWRIVAWDEYSTTNTSPIWSFSTEANIPPYAPSDPSPSDGATDVSLYTNLSWVGGDPNIGDLVKYDVYFGTVSPPPMVSNNQSTNCYEPGILIRNTTYYWRIVSWDSNNASNHSNIWHFTTASPPDAPIIDGPTSGKRRTVYFYTFKAVDPDGFDLYYYIDWGDDSVIDWFGPYDSGIEVTGSHRWNNTGTYIIRAKARNILGEEGPWGEFTVTIPRNKSTDNVLFRLIGQFPFLQRLLFFII
jgi:hypothetical protein